MTNLKKPTISICIPTYNRAPLLDQTIQSVIRQTIKPFEIIIVDNGSKDKTVEVIHKYKKYGFKYIKNTKNIGMVANWNKCVKSAKGEYLTFLHSDDLISPNWYKEWEATILKYPAKFYTSPLAIIDIDNKVKYTCHPFKKSIYIKKENCYRNFFYNLSPHLTPTAASIYHKSIFYELNFFDEKLKTETDVLFSFKVFAKYDIYYLNKLLFAYRSHAQQGLEKINESKNLQMELNRFNNYVLIIKKFYKDYFKNDKKMRYFILVPILMTLASINLYLVKLEIKKIVNYYKITKKHFPDLFTYLTDWVWFLRIQLRFVQRATLDRFISFKTKQQLIWLKNIREFTI